MHDDQHLAAPAHAAGIEAETISVKMRKPGREIPGDRRSILEFAECDVTTPICRLASYPRGGMRMANPRAARPGDPDPKTTASLRYEQSVLGGVLLDESALREAMERITAADFFLPQNRVIFACLVDMQTRPDPVPIVPQTLIGELERAGKLEAAGGVGYLSSLADGLPQRAHVAFFADRIKEDSNSRAALADLPAIAAAIESREDPAEILQRILKTAERMQPKTNATARLVPLTPAQLAASCPEPVEPVVYPLAFKGMLSVLDGSPKAAGKTTLLLHAVRACLRDQTFLGHSTQRSKILLVSEEYRRTILIAIERIGLILDDCDFYILPRDLTAGIPWLTLAAALEKMCADLKIDWLIVDTFYTVAEINEEGARNDPGIVATAIAPLRRIAGKLDMAVTISRHERKSGGDVGKSGAGSGGLTGEVDLVARLQRVASSAATVRELEMIGRIGSELLRIELVDGAYIVRSNDTSTEAKDLAVLVDKILNENPQTSQRELERRTSASRFKIVAAAATKGWEPIGKGKGWRIASTVLDLAGGESGES